MESTGFVQSDQQNDNDILDFKINVQESELRDLKRRLLATRWPEKETVADWTQGVPLEKAKALIEHWSTKYDWRVFESRINEFPQFKTAIDGLGIHFLHVRSKHEDALPIILSHGWPGSIVELLDVINPLVDPVTYGGRADQAFHVVIPSLPGFGFSDKPTESGWDLVRIARAWAELMRRLGYQKWVAQGGDWGSAITHVLGLLKPQGLVAGHVTWPLVFPDPLPTNPTDAEKKAMEEAEAFVGDGHGFFRQQATRPQTIGYALADSPAGQACWIYEKFHAWTDNQGNPEDAIAVDRILDNISYYWLTNSAASSARIYWENWPTSFSAGRIELPMAASIFLREIYRAPKEWAVACWPNLIYWNELKVAGHFPALEQPLKFVEEIRQAFESIRV